MASPRQEIVNPSGKGNISLGAACHSARIWTKGAAAAGNDRKAKAVIVATAKTFLNMAFTCDATGTGNDRATFVPCANRACFRGFFALPSQEVSSGMTRKGHGTKPFQRVLQFSLHHTCKNASQLSLERTIRNTRESDMGNKWRNEDFNRWDEEEIRRSRAASGRYDEPRQFSQEYSGSSQYGHDSDYQSDRERARQQRDRLRRAAPDMERQYEQESFSQPGTFYYGGQPQRRFGYGPGEMTYDTDDTADTSGVTRVPLSGGYAGYGYSDPSRIDANYRDMARFERDLAHDDDVPHAKRPGLFHDDPNRGPIDRMRNWMSHRGKGPKGYKRSDDRIRDDISDHLTQDHHVDATLIEVIVLDTECTLNGTVPTREQKRRAEDIAERVMGVKHVQNNLRVAPTATTSLSTQDRTGTMSTTIGSNPTLSANRNSST
jgi:hypothetical protein